MLSVFDITSLVLIAGTVLANPSSKPSVSMTSHPGIESSAYSETVDCGSVTQLDIFRRARLYLLQSSPDDKLLLNDKEMGDLVSSGLISMVLPRTESSAGGIYSVSYVLTIECANRKYRATIAKIEVLQSTSTRSVPAALFKLQTEQDTKQFHTELDMKLKARLEDLKLRVKEYKNF
ncbi:hypothetical protein DYBT9275_00359 [Dyadobacter sp. CECT 9275]|uniref:DUF4468 domain-containing protein n=1 Tax=Dyadobacter helix TaxID=2822344 RepID=A0A916J6X2_9BACT|nr:DUF4468 domain-containing protein [Dyadobacter sp. CECT 9275]CAG4989729.1 hypothetical protein DYBT9275_00359 [Dyadobacter sp. CECT 9275]